MRNFPTRSLSLCCAAALLGSASASFDAAGISVQTAQTPPAASQPQQQTASFSIPDGPSESLAALLEPFRKRAKLPCLGAVLLTPDGIQEIAVVGVRRQDHAEAATWRDRFHLGSCTKAMTATLIGLLVQEGRIRWETTLAEAFPELGDEMHADFRSVTVEQLLRHRGGLTGGLPVPLRRAIVEGPDDLRARRAQVVRFALTTRPAHPPGKYEYSNVGYLIAGAMAERCADATWETLIQQRVFQPLGMTSAGFGAPGVLSPIADGEAPASKPTGEAPKPTGATEPWGHTSGLFIWQSVRPGPLADNPPALGPAGTAHASLIDWARFAAVHLSASAAQQRLGLLPETLTRMHTPPERSDYAAGWVVRPDGRRGRLLWHNGSNTMWYCEARLWPDHGVAVLVATNASDDRIRAVLEECSTALFDRVAAP